MKFLNPAVFIACLLPLAGLVYAALTGRLGPDPAKSIMLETGAWALRFLLLSLAASPLRRLVGLHWPMRLRRMLGLYAFFYASVHLVAFCHFYTGWSSEQLLEELAKRPYITVGALAWLLLVPLALTSTHGMRRRLGRTWRRLHRLVYPAAVLACIHLAWQIRSDFGEALCYATLAAALLGYRLWAWRRQPSTALG